MNAKLIAYWIITVLFALFMAMGGYIDFAPSPEIAKEIAKTGYPLFFFKILGFWKMLGGLALLLPKTPRLKEWAYAGFFFNLTGASATHVFLGDPLPQVIVPLVALGIGSASYILRPADRRLTPL
jgi:heme/copper-type cytochrome/quinol oxidase subunit 3